MRVLRNAFMWIGAVALAPAVLFFLLIIVAFFGAFTAWVSAWAVAGATADMARSKRRYVVYGWRYCWLVRVAAYTKAFSREFKTPAKDMA